MEVSIRIVSPRAFRPLFQGKWEDILAIAVLTCVVTADLTTGSRAICDASASAGTILPVDPALAREAHDYRHKPKAIAATFDYYARRVLRQDASALD